MGIGILGEILGGGVGKLVKDVVGTFHLSPEAKLEFEREQAANEQVIRMKEFELEMKAQEREAGVIEAQKAIIVSEMQQGDAFTKRARPTVVYAGLAFMFLNHVFIPMFAFFSGQPIPAISLPGEFWWAWTGVVGTWMVGRTMEKRGSQSPIVKTITGTR